MKRFAEEALAVFITPLAFPLGLETVYIITSLKLHVGC